YITVVHDRRWRARYAGSGDRVVLDPVDSIEHEITELPVVGALVKDVDLRFVDHRRRRGCISQHDVGTLDDHLGRSGPGAAIERVVPEPRAGRVAAAALVEDVKEAVERDG